MLRLGLAREQEPRSVRIQWQDAALIRELALMRGYRACSGMVPGLSWEAWFVAYRCPVLPLSGVDPDPGNDDATPRWTGQGPGGLVARVVRELVVSDDDRVRQPRLDGESETPRYLSADRLRCGKERGAVHVFEPDTVDLKFCWSL